jgi:hypothetical protein
VLLVVTMMATQGLLPQSFVHAVLGSVYSSADMKRDPNICEGGRISASNLCAEVQTVVKMVRNQSNYVGLPRVYEAPTHGSADSDPMTAFHSNVPHALYQLEISTLVPRTSILGYDRMVLITNHLPTSYACVKDRGWDIPVASPYERASPNSIGIIHPYAAKLGIGRRSLRGLADESKNPTRADGVRYDFDCALFMSRTVKYKSSDPGCENNAAPELVPPGSGVVEVFVSYNQAV